MWYNYFHKIYLINLSYRTDRLLESSTILTKYEVPVTIFEAIENIHNPCLGLVKTIQTIFKICLNEGAENVLLFEDDIFMLVAPERFSAIMDNCVKQLPQKYNIFYLGCNHPAYFKERYSDNLLPVHQAYSTHAAAYSKKAMEFIVNSKINEPIDNFIVREFQPLNQCYCSYPMLVSQRPDYSDIGKKYTDWTNHLEKRFNENIKYLT